MKVAVLLNAKVTEAELLDLCQNEHAEATHDEDGHNCTAISPKVILSIELDVDTMAELVTLDELVSSFAVLFYHF